MNSRARGGSVIAALRKRVPLRKARPERKKKPWISCMAGEQSGLQPQVFISHTGSDELGRIFAASILQPALEAAGLTTYIDHANLQLGCAWPAELVKAAATSAVFVIVLTQSYATRFWCLRELDIALHSHPDHPTAATPYIIPVYMQHHSLLQHLTVEQLRTDILQRMAALRDVKDSAELQDLQRLALDPERMLRNIQGLKSTQGARRQHQALQLCAPPQEKRRQQQLQVALLPCSNSRTVVPAAKDEEWVIARRVAAAALQQLPAKQRLAYIPPDLVGYEQQLADLTAQLVVDEPRTLGLWLHGPGGLGKTTMADMLFNTLSSTKQFKAAKVELDLEGSSSEQLEKCLVQLLKGLGEPATEGSSTQLLQSLAQLVQKHKVLLLLDNVNHDSQLDGLLPLVFSSGSRVIITSRVRALPSSRAYKALVRKDAAALRHHSMETLDTASARHLFRQCHGFDEQQLQQLGLCELEQQLLQACSGLPLALQVIGGALCEEEDTSAADTYKLWQEVAAFSHGGWTPTDMGSSEARLQDVVYHSFSKLTEAAQNMFLDSVSVLQGQPVSKAMLVWEVWWPNQARQALKRLKQLSLISTKTTRYSNSDPPSILDERLLTLDVIRVLGQSIIRKHDRDDRLGGTYVGSRVWVGSGHEVQGLIQGMKPVGVNLEGCTSKEIFDKLKDFDFSDVRILINRHLPPGVLYRPLKLLWISRPHCPYGHKRTDVTLSAAPQTGAICLKKLVVLDLLDFNVYPTPSQVCEELYGGWRSCWDGWVELIGAIAAGAKLPSLRGLDIDALLLQCWLGNNQPSDLVDILSCSKRLEQVTVHNVGWAGWLQVWTPEHSDLRLLQLQQADSLQGTLSEDAHILRIQEKLGDLTSLQELSLPRFSRVSLPEAFGQLAALEVFRVEVTNTCLPVSFVNLTDMRWLDLSGSAELSSLLDSFGALVKLETLSLAGCGLSSLPDSIGALGALTQLDLSKCGLSSLPESVRGWTALQRLDLSGCDLSSLPESIKGWTALQHLDMQWCLKLSSLPDSFQDVSKLRSLVLSGCCHLTSLPKSCGALVALTCLHMSHCTSLSSLPEHLGRLTALQTLNLSDCASLSTLPEHLEGLTALRDLPLSTCVGLTSLPASIWELPALGELRMSGCSRLSGLPAMSKVSLAALHTIDLTGCGSLLELPNPLKGLYALTALDMSGCSQLRSLPGSITSLTALVSLCMSGCAGLSSLPVSFAGLGALTELDLSRCSQLQSLPNLKGLFSLVRLEMVGCVGVTSLPESLEDLTRLEFLSLSGCSGLSSLPDSVGCLAALSILDLSFCVKLTSLPAALERLPSLLDLRVTGCDQLPNLTGRLARLRDTGLEVPIDPDIWLPQVLRHRVNSKERE